jgi:hypothetical protein
MNGRGAAYVPALLIIGTTGAIHCRGAAHPSQKNERYNRDNGILSFFLTADGGNGRKGWAQDLASAIDFLTAAQLQ